ncbi:MAG TPA: hypothetical protein PLW35_09740 [Verrucomicrobiota bacterium]|nr:hypothetical protein [Verrucomicrobiota bacterium]HOK77988.1 hypothetical protein [Verrucomicrobiota bacterium]
MNYVLVGPWDWALLASAGKAAVMGIYLLLLAGIVLMPKALMERAEQQVPLWKNLRFWAALICLVQIVVYGILG